MTTTMTRTAFADRAHGRLGTALRNAMLVGIAAAVLAGCNSHRLYTSTIPPTRVEDRHPITLAGEFQELNLPVTASVRNLRPKERADIEVYFHGYRENGAGPLFVSAPSQTPNEVAATALVGEIRTIAVAMGIPDTAIAYESYTPTEGAYNFPVAMRYQVARTVLPKCGYHPDNLAGSIQNRPWEDFGCSTQRNLGLMVANPHDLRVPRGDDERWAPRRDRVFGDYTRGNVTASQANQDDGSAISEVAN